MLSITNVLAFRLMLRFECFRKIILTFILGKNEIVLRIHCQSKKISHGLCIKDALFFSSNNDEHVTNRKRKPPFIYLPRWVMSLL